jgi:hypothetical protein
MRWAGHVARMGEERKMYKVLVGNPEGKRPLGRPRRRWEDGVRMDLREIGLGVWIGSGQGPMAGCCECGDEPSGSCATELVSLLVVSGRMLPASSQLNHAGLKLCQCVCNKLKYFSCICCYLLSLFCQLFRRSM